MNKKIIFQCVSICRNRAGKIILWYKRCEFSTHSLLMVLYGMKVFNSGKSYVTPFASPITIFPSGPSGREMRGLKFWILNT